MLSFLGRPLWSSFFRLPFWVPRPCWLCVSVFLETLKECIPDLFNVLSSDKIENHAENPASLEQFVRVIWVARPSYSPQFDSNKSLYSYYYGLIISLTLLGIVGRTTEKPTWGHLEPTVDWCLGLSLGPLSPQLQSTLRHFSEFFPHLGPL